MRRALVLAPALLLVVCGAARQEASVFEYVRSPGPVQVRRVEVERDAIRNAAAMADAERWGVTLALLIEVSRGASEPADRAAALDAVLEELVRPAALGLISKLSDQRRLGLHEALAGLDQDDPVGMRPYTRQLAQQRLDLIERDVLGAADPDAALDGLLSQHGWRAAGGQGPQGRQRVRDRADYGVIDRHDVFRLEGMARWHMLLPPTEGLGGVPREELERKWQRARNLSAHVDRLWAHQDGPRVHDFLLDLALRDNTGIVRLVHADTQVLAHHDRTRRWRLREAIWRLSDG